jgi:chromosome segregation protein
MNFNQLKQLKGKIQEATQKLNVLLTAINTTKTELAGHKDKTAKAKKLFLEASTDLKNLKAKFFKAELKIERVDSDLAEKQIEVTTIQNSLIELNKKIEAKTKEFKNHEDKADKKIVSINSKVKNTEKQANKKMLSIQHDLDNFKLLVEGKDEKLDELDNKIKSLVIKKQDLTDEITELKGDEKSLSKDVKDFKAEFEVNQDKLKSKKKAIKDLDKQFTTSTERVDKLNEDIKILDGVKQEAQKEVDGLKKEKIYVSQFHQYLKDMQSEVQRNYEEAGLQYQPYEPFNPKN